jgi:hypothetical protein
MKAIFLDIPVDKAGNPEPREALRALRKVVAACKGRSAHDLSIRIKDEAAPIAETIVSGSRQR